MMRVWIALSLIAVSVGCSGKGEGPPPNSVPAANPDSQVEHAPPKEGHSVHSNHGGHEQMQMPAATARKLVVKTDPSQPQAGEVTKLLLQILDNDGQPITKFALLHEKLVHLIVVREGLDEFSHLHPLVDASGNITIEHVFPKAGQYRLFADHQPQGQTPGLARGELIVAGDDESAAALVSNASDEIAVGAIKAHVAFQPGEQETTVRFHLVDASDQVVSDLQPYLGAMGHLVIISADGADYVHAHPLSESRSAPEGVVEFAAHFPKPGLYKAWGQFQRHDTVFTVPFVLQHSTAHPAAH
jgi:hypothetical protein